MKKLFTILGVIFAVIIVVVVIAAAILIPRALKLDREAKAYIQESVPKIVTNWSSQELVDRATQQLLDTAKSRAEIDRMFGIFRSLGSLKRLDEPQGTVVSTATGGSGMVTTGDYVASADFEKGPAMIRIQLRRVDGNWKINGFRINSDVFLPATSNKATNSTPSNP